MNTFTTSKMNTFRWSPPSRMRQKGKNLAVPGQSMAVGDNEQPPAPNTETSAPEVAERGLWEWSPDEKRVLIITFVAGLASIIVGAGVIGGAIALARGIRAINIPMWVLITPTAVYVFAVIGDVTLRRRYRGESLPRTTSLINWTVFSILLLAWIGVAAGIQ